MNLLWHIFGDIAASSFNPLSVNRYMEDSREIEKAAGAPRHKLSFKDLLPRKNYFVTPLLIYANVLVFLLMALSGVDPVNPSADALIQWGGNIRFLTINGQWWRLFSSLFLHAGILHLAFNMYALLYAGSLLETVVSRNKFIFAYLVSGIAASVASLVMHENVVSVGASGAIFGLFGVLLVMLALKQFNSFGIPAKGLLVNIAFFIVYNLVIGFGKQGIDNAAHVGGLLGGVTVGLAYCAAAKMKIPSMAVYAGLTVITGCVSIMSITGISDKLGEYDRMMQEFAANEEKAMWMFREKIPASMSDVEKNYFKTRYITEGVNLWEENIQLVRKLKENGYEGELNRQLDLLIEYSTLRQQWCRKMIALLDATETTWDDVINEVKELTAQIEDKLKEIEELNTQQ